MPWNGSGTYTRGYSSWTSDATNGLPISATKFDLEDNDFAAGIQNCLTIDGQNKPNETLNWAQAIALTRGSDGTLFSVGRTGGTNNPLFQINLADATGVTLDLTTAQQLALATNGTNRLAIAGAGNMTINAPASGNSVTVTGPANARAAYFVGNSTTGQSFGLIIQAGTNSSDDALRVQNQAGTVNYFVVQGGGVVSGNDGTNLFELGYKDVPLNSQGTNYTAVVSDRGKAINGTASISVTIPSGVFAGGEVLTICVGSGATITIVQGSGTTLQWGGNGSATGSRTLTGAGVATILWLTNAVGIITGAGLT
jgi:hypothetical protein